MAWFLDDHGNNREVNDPETQFDIGNKYYHGEGVAQDYNEAIKWYFLAADQGCAPAQNDLGLSYTKGHGVNQNDYTAMGWFRRAADQGNSEAQYNFGRMYANGQGVAQDYSEAIKWYRLAADQGHSQAITEIEELERQLTSGNTILQKSNKSDPKQNVPKPCDPTPQTE